MAVRSTPEQYLGHNFQEEYWAITYDFLSQKVIEDHTPGPYADDYQDPEMDRAPFRNTEFYVAYMNLGQVQTIYAALTNYSFDNRNFTNQGVAPFQVILQHFRAPGGRHVLVQNSFAGLIAYQENSTTANGVPDADDDVYFGYTLTSEFHKHLLNRYLLSIPEIADEPFSEEMRPKVTPIELDRVNDSSSIEYTFGMQYENLFVVWHDLNVETDLNASTSGVAIMDKIVAISTIQSLNFTYKLTGEIVEDRPVNVTLTTEYDIGAVTDLWIIGDGEAETEGIGGAWYQHPEDNRKIANYNNATQIESRLGGTEDLNGFSLGVANFARMVVLDASLNTEDSTSTIVNGTEINPDTASGSADRVNLNILDRPAFLIDFASKPDYTLDGGDPQPAPVQIYPALNVREPVLQRLDSMVVGYLTPHIQNAVRHRVQQRSLRLDLDPEDISIDVTRHHLFYTINFPEWGGRQINQDPTFVAFADPTVRTGPLAFLQEIDGYTFGMMAFAAVAMILLITKKVRR